MSDWAPQSPSDIVADLEALSKRIVEDSKNLFEPRPEPPPPQWLLDKLAQEPKRGD